MEHFKLITYTSKMHEPKPGLLIDNRVITIGAMINKFERLRIKDSTISQLSMINIIESWQIFLPVLKEIIDDAQNGLISNENIQPLDNVNLCPPLLYPNSLICAGANYIDHMMEMTGKTIEKAKVMPYFFLKSPIHTIIGPEDCIRLPNNSKKIDWEAELAVVIGKITRHVRVDDALSYVAGYTIINDLTARDLTMRLDWPNFKSDFFAAKTFDTSAPMGPWIVPSEQIDNPNNLNIKLWVNDNLMQDSNTENMIFDIAEQISHLSNHITLKPGDVLSTGTPAGVGKPRNIYLHPGDRIRVYIEGIGTLENNVVQGD